MTTTPSGEPQVELRAEAPPSPTSNYRMFGALRVFLALLVVISHSWALRSARFVNVLDRISLGSVAVVGFFVLSGYVIADALDLFYRERPVEFITNRILRILPPFLAALAVAFIVHATVLHSGRRWFSSSNVLRNLITLAPFGVPPPYKAVVSFTWAIRIEVLFYGVVFGVLVLRLIVVRSSAAPRAAGAVLAQATAVAFLGLHVGVEYFGVTQRVFDVAFVPYFLAGMALFGLHQRRRRRDLVAVLCLAGLALVHFSRYVQGEVDLGRAWAARLASTEVLAPVVMLALLIVLVDLMARVDAPAPLRRLDRWLGQYSYPVYLNHGIVLTALASGRSPSRSPAIQVGFVALSVGLGVAVNGVVERPTRAIRDRIRGTVLT